MTSTTFTMPGVQATLELARGVHQEMRVATKAGDKTFLPGHFVDTKQ